MLPFAAGFPSRLLSLLWKKTAFGGFDPASAGPLADLVERVRSPVVQWTWLLGWWNLRKCIAVRMGCHPLEARVEIVHPHPVAWVGVKTIAELLLAEFEAGQDDGDEYGDQKNEPADALDHRERIELPLPDPEQPATQPQNADNPQIS